jgi:hypothetical protein
MTEERANKVYDILVRLGGAVERDRDGFVYHHSRADDICEEWRFSGSLGYGGKYYSDYNRIDCYKENFNEKTKVVIDKINKELKMV